MLRAGAAQLNVTPGAISQILVIPDGAALLSLPAGSRTEAASMVTVTVPVLVGVMVDVHVMLSLVAGALAEPVPAVKLMSPVEKVAGSIASLNVIVISYGVVVGSGAEQLNETSGPTVSHVLVMEFVEAVLLLPVASVTTPAYIATVTSPWLVGVIVDVHVILSPVGGAVAVPVPAVNAISVSSNVEAELKKIGLKQMVE